MGEDNSDILKPNHLSVVISINQCTRNCGSESVSDLLPLTVGYVEIFNETKLFKIHYGKSMGDMNESSVRSLNG